MKEADGVMFQIRRQPDDSTGVIVTYNAAGNTTGGLCLITADGKMIKWYVKSDAVKKAFENVKLDLVDFLLVSGIQNE
jgi:hypothetical protein